MNCSRLWYNNSVLPDDGVCINIIMACLVNIKDVMENVFTPCGIEFCYMARPKTVTMQYMDLFSHRIVQLPMAITRFTIRFIYEYQVAHNCTLDLETLGLHSDTIASHYLRNIQLKPTMKLMYPSSKILKIIWTPHTIIMF